MQGLADVETLMSAFNRNLYNVLALMPSDLPRTSMFSATHWQPIPTLRLEAQRERGRSGGRFQTVERHHGFRQLLRRAAIMAIGATLGAVNCL